MRVCECAHALCVGVTELSITCTNTCVQSFLLCVCVCVWGGVCVCLCVCVCVM